jgi:hypothetical protein
MGLDTTHGCWHGAYSGFNRWRESLAKVAGYTVQTITWDDGTKLPAVLVDYGHLNIHAEGEWDKTPDDPLLILIVHSDCDGVIHPKQAKPLADRLEELLPLLPTGEFFDWKKDTKEFIDGLRLAINKNEDVEFG